MILKKFLVSKLLDSSNLYEIKPKINLMVLHLLYFELLFHIYTIYNQKLYMKDFDEKFFFESKDEKICFFKDVISEELMVVTNKEGKGIKDKKDIKNENFIIYNVKNKNETIL